MTAEMNYEVTIGLEVHVQVRTRTKMFCACPNRFGAAPNTLVCPVCLGYPGVLPTPNREAIHKTILAGLMCDCRIAPYAKFDRKSYWYPDMPKNYQISQYDLPFCLEGKLRIEGKSLTGEVAPNDVGITRIHLEEDVGKSSHFAAHSAIDFNRAGVPLMEIVSEPDMSTPDEAYAYLVAVKQTMQYAEIGDCDMEKGQMRCDVNVSVRPAGQQELNLKTEIKNLNSLKAVHRGLAYEITRQTAVLEEGGELRQTTRAWDDVRGETFVMREKEEAHDYRYFPEPDLMPMEITEAQLAEIRQSLPETPAARRRRFVERYELPEYDAHVLCLEKGAADYYEACVQAGGQPKKISNWIMTELLRELASSGQTISECKVQPRHLVDLLELVEKKTINGKIAKEVFVEMFKTGREAAAIVQKQGLEQVTDASSIQEFVLKAIAESPKAVGEYKSGKETALNFLVGQVMRFSRGKANPQLAVEALKKELE